MTTSPERRRRVFVPNGAARQNLRRYSTAPMEMICYCLRGGWGVGGGGGGGGGWGGGGVGGGGGGWGGGTGELLSRP